MVGDSTCPRCRGFGLTLPLAHVDRAGEKLFGELAALYQLLSNVLLGATRALYRKRKPWVLGGYNHRFSPKFLGDTQRPMQALGAHLVPAGERLKWHAMDFLELIAIDLN
jgi:hypothetical protein